MSHHTALPTATPAPPLAWIASATLHLLVIASLLAPLAWWLGTTAEWRPAAGRIVGWLQHGLWQPQAVSHERLFWTWVIVLAAATGGWRIVSGLWLAVGKVAERSVSLPLGVLDSAVDALPFLLLPAGAFLMRWSEPSAVRWLRAGWARTILMEGHFRPHWQMAADFAPWLFPLFAVVGLATVLGYVSAARLSRLAGDRFDDEGQPVEGLPVSGAFVGLVLGGGLIGFWLAARWGVTEAKPKDGKDDKGSQKLKDRPPRRRRYAFSLSVGLLLGYLIPFLYAGSRPDGVEALRHFPRETELAVDYLVEVRGVDRVSQDLQPLLNDPNPTIRKRAHYAVQCLRSAEAVDIPEIEPRNVDFDWQQEQLDSPKPVDSNSTPKP